MKQDRRSSFVNYKKTTAVPILNTDRVKWPIGSGRAGAKCHQELTDEIRLDVKEILEQNIDLSKVGKLFTNPTRIWRMSHHIIRSLKTVNTEKAEIQKIMAFFFDVVSTIKDGSLFNDDGYNTIASSEEINEIMKKKTFYSTSLDESKELHKLIGILWSYTEALYFVAHEVSVEIHGVYKMTDKSAIIRDYINLSPSELWPNVPLLPYSNIRIITKYQPHLNLEFDLYNNHYIKNGNFLTDLVSYNLEVDGKEIDIKDVSSLTEKVERATISIIEKVNGWTEIDQAKKYVEIFWFRKKPLRDVLNKDWRPPTSIFDRIDKEGIPPKKSGPVNPEKIYDLLDIL
jgi:CRISPR/Cas system-associated exonuclease Cas4 (RecB family)